MTEFEWFADSVTLIELTWLHLVGLWPPGNEDFARLDQRLQQIDSDLDAIVYQCVSLTLSPAVNDLMCNPRIGQPLDIEFEFGNYLPRDPVLRKRLLLEFAQEPVVLDCGVVDADSGSDLQNSHIEENAIAERLARRGTAAVGIRHTCAAGCGWPCAPRMAP